MDGMMGMMKNNMGVMIPNVAARTP